MWTSESVEQLRELWAEGNSATTCAVILNTSRNAVIGKVHRLNLPQRSTDKRLRVPVGRPRERVRPERTVPTFNRAPARVRKQRAEPQTKDELRAMLAEALRNTALL